MQVLDSNTRNCTRLCFGFNGVNQNANLVLMNGDFNYRVARSERICGLHMF